MKNSQSGLAVPLIIAIVAFGIVAIAAGAFFYNRSSVAIPEGAATTTGAGNAGTGISPGVGETSPGAVPGGDVTTTVDDLRKFGKNMECDIRNPDGTATSYTGKLYTTNDKARSQINSMISTQTAIEANAIFKEGTVYVWSIMNGQIMTANTISEEEATKANSQMTDEQKQMAEQYRQQMIFNCREWTPDNSMFETPTGATFEPMKISQ